MGIGEDADLEMLMEFIDDPEQRVFSAADARGIRNFFRMVTMSVTSRSVSQNPNASVEVPDFGENEGDLEDYF